ncbi:MAG: OmpP1/FadL family transporter [Myxococcota bacterium]
MRGGRLAAVVVLGALSAQANSFETFGFGPRGTAMAGAVTAAADDYTAVFYNPSMLVLRKELGFGFSFTWNRAVTSVRSAENGRELDCAYCQPPDAVGYDVGLLFPLAGKVKNRVALGVGLHLPSQRFLRVLSPDPSRPFWYQFNSNPERFVFYAAAGIRLLDNLSIGIGVQALDDLIGQGANARVDLFSRAVKLRELDSHMANRAGPVAGLYWAVTPRLRLGLSFRWEMALLVRIPAQVDLEGIGSLGFSVQGVVHYSPHTLAGGVAFDVTEKLTLTLDGQWMNWRAAPSPYLDLDIDLSGDTLRALGIDEALDLSSPRVTPGFADTLGGRLGLEYRVSERFAARAGAFYRPTPVPRQDAPSTNILDASAVGGALGVGIAFDDPLEVFVHPVKLDVATQGALLLPREAKKEPTDSVPPYTYSARLHGFTVAIRYDF